MSSSPKSKSKFGSFSVSFDATERPACETPLVIVVEESVDERDPLKVVVEEPPLVKDETLPVRLKEAVEERVFG